MEIRLDYRCMFSAHLKQYKITIHNQAQKLINIYKHAHTHTIKNICIQEIVHYEFFSG